MRDTTKRRALRFTLCYDVVTQESAQDGDTAENGFYLPGGYQYPLSRTNKRERTLNAAGRGEFDLDPHAALCEARDLGICEDTGGGWFSTTDGHTDYRTGDNTSYTLHPNGVTPATFDRIKRWLNGQDVLTGVSKKRRY